MTGAGHAESVLETVDVDVLVEVTSEVDTTVVTPEMVLAREGQLDAAFHGLANVFLRERRQRGRLGQHDGRG